MAWSDWMCPVPEAHHLLTLERQRRAIEGYNREQALDQLYDLCELLLRQDLIIRGATRRIAELECRLGLDEMG